MVDWIHESECFQVSTIKIKPKKKSIVSWTFRRISSKQQNIYEYKKKSWIQFSVFFNILSFLFSSLIPLTCQPLIKNPYQLNPFVFLIVSSFLFRWQNKHTPHHTYTHFSTGVHGKFTQQTIHSRKYGPCADIKEYNGRETQIYVQYMYNVHESKHFCCVRL